MSKPRLFSNPFRYWRWASIERPAYFYSCVVGLIGPVVAFGAPPLRHAMGDGPRPMIPLTYPSKTSHGQLLSQIKGGMDGLKLTEVSFAVPKGPRPRPKGFGDDEEDSI